MTSVAHDSLAIRAWDALGTVVDPELDEPITELGFVTALSVLAGEVEQDGHEVHVLLRLPTYFCAPNFAYLMVSDAHDAILALPDVRSVRVELADHFASDEINAGVAAESGFRGAFGDQASGELAELRHTFRAKAHLACLERACRKLIADGWQVDALAHTKLGDVPASPERDSLLRRRAELGLPTDEGAPLFVEDSGAPVDAERLPARLRFAKAVRVSIEGNSGMCRGLLKTRYGNTEKELR